MRLLCLLVGWIGLTFAPLHAGHSGPQVLMRVYVQSPGEGMSPQQVLQVRVPPDNEVIQIRSLPEVTEADLTDVQTDASGSVHFIFDQIGQANLDAATAQNQGRIMVVAIDGVVVYAPVIDQEITTGVLVIPHPLPPQVVQLLKKTAQLNVHQTKSL
jgi:preprotein translocase subunit SecD